MADVAMPRLSDSMEEGTILKWLKADGDPVSAGDELVEIETDKANMTHAAEEAGVLQIVAPEGSTLPVGEVIARIGEASANGASAPAEAPTEAPAEAAAEADPRSGGEGGTGPEPPATAIKGPVKASPVARRLARELGVDLDAVKGSGPGGRVVKEDLQPAAPTPAKPAPGPAATPPAPPARPVATAEPHTSIKGETTPQELTRTQQVVARRMAESKATAPEFVLHVEVEMDAAVELRKELKAAAGEQPAPSFNDFVVKAAALALKDVPRANGAYRDGRFELYSRVNVGVAVAAQDALIVPTVFDADQKSLGTIAGETRVLAQRVRDGVITPPELSGGTFTVSNLGMFGIRQFIAVINPPQAAILAVGALEPRAVARDGRVVIRHMLDLTLSCDHRILYGADAANFLGAIRQRLEAPLQLVL
jgi:pyruvate dehydrogenase E2 component (dihydrolipoamide acetyltransferase)